MPVHLTAISLQQKNVEPHALWVQLQVSKQTMQWWLLSFSLCSSSQLLSLCGSYTLFMNTLFINIIIALYLLLQFLSWPLFSCFFFKASPICLLVPTYPYLPILLQSAVLSVHTVWTLTQEAKTLGKNLSVPGLSISTAYWRSHCKENTALAGNSLVSQRWYGDEQFKDVLFLDIQKALKPSSHSFQPVIFQKKKWNFQCRHISLIMLNCVPFFVNKTQRYIP